MSNKGNESTIRDTCTLPYNGNLQEAIRKHDREAVKYLMRRRESDNCSDEFSESKTEYRNALCDALVSLGFSKMQVAESVTANSSEARAVKCLLDSKRHFPSPPSRHKCPLDSHDHKGDNVVTSHMLGGLDPDSTFALLQCCVDNPGVSQTSVFAILKRLASLRTANILSADACIWMRSVLIGGYLDEVQCLLSSLDPLQISASPSSALSESGATDLLLQSYLCPITREILIEPVTLQCGHNFSRTALELSVFSGNGRCPICKAAMLTTEFAVNVVLRDTIERLYPHVLLRRAVDDIQAAQRNGIRELRSVMRWLQNFPRSSEVIHAVVVALEDWISQSHDNRDKIVRDGHVALLCKVFAVLDINSRPFADLLSVMSTLVCVEDTNLSRIVPSLDESSATILSRPSNDSSTPTSTTISAVKSMLAADIHADLMRILTYKINSSVDQIGLRLLVHLLARMDAVRMREFMQVTQPVDAALPLPQGMGSDEGSSLDETSDSLETAISNADGRLVPYLPAMLNLACMYVDLEGVVGVVCDVCVKLICWPAFSPEQHVEHARRLVDTGVVGIIATFLSYYSGNRGVNAAEDADNMARRRGRVFNPSSAVFKCVTLLAKLACRCTADVQAGLMDSCLQHLIELLKGWNRSDGLSPEFRINGDVLFASCEAVAAILFGTESPSACGRTGPLPEIEDLDEICSLLEYRWQLHNISKCCVPACPRIEPLAANIRPACAEVRMENLFGLVRRTSAVESTAALSVLRLASPECFVPFCAGRPGILGSGASGSSDVSLSMTVLSADPCPQGSLQLMIVREVDVGKFSSWCAYAFPDASLTGSSLGVVPSFPFVALDMNTGNVSRCGVSAGSDEDLGINFVEELMPMAVALDGTKRFRLDVGSMSAMVSCNGFSGMQWTFPSVIRQPSRCRNHIFDDECSNAISDFSTDRMEEKTANYTDGSLSPDRAAAESSPSVTTEEDTAERFLSTVLAAVASEHRVPLPPSRPQRASRARSGSRRDLREREARDRDTRRVRFARDSSSGQNEAPESTPGLAVFMILTPPAESPSVSRDSPARICDRVLISALLEKASLSDAEVALAGSSIATTPSPLQWAYRDVRYLQITEDGTLVQHCASHTQKRIQGATAVTSSTSAGVHLYQFNLSSCAGPFALGLCTADAIPNFSYCGKSECARLAQFSVEYSSCGAIHASLPAGPHPCAPPVPVKTSVLARGDVVHILLVQEGTGSVRIFHNDQLVFTLDHLSTMCSVDDGMSAFVHMSHPNDCVRVEHTIPDSVVNVNWKWLDNCFSHMRKEKKSYESFHHILAARMQRCDMLSRISKGAFVASYHPSGDVSFLQTMITTIRIASQHTQSPTIVAAAVLQVEELINQDSGRSFRMFPSPCPHEHTTSYMVDMTECVDHCESPVITQRRVFPRWTTKCPLAHDISMVLIALFHTVRRHLAHSHKNGAAVERTVGNAVSSLIVTLVTGDSPLFPPSALLNLGAGQVIAELLPPSFSPFPRDNESTILNAMTFVRATLNCMHGSHASHITSTHLLMSSGLIKRLGEVCQVLSSTDHTSYDLIQGRDMCEKISVLLSEVIHRAAGRSPRKLLDYSDGCTEHLNSGVEQASVVEHNDHRYMQLLQQLVQKVAWHNVVSQSLSACISNVPEISADFRVASLPSMLSEALLSLVLAGSSSYDVSPSVVCFDLRAQSTAHVWHQSVFRHKTAVVGSDEAVILAPAQYHAEEVRVSVAASSGDALPLLCRSGEEAGWVSEDTVMPQWIDVCIPAGEEWSDLEILQQSHDDSAAPEQVCIRVGGAESQNGFVKDLLPGSACSSWQSLLTSTEAASVKRNTAGRNLTLRLEISKTFDSGCGCVVAGLRVVARTHLSESLLGLSRAATLPTITQTNIPDIIGSHRYTSMNWRESLYFTLLEGNTREMESLISGRELECCQLQMFSGYGPWLWGHPGNIGNMALCVPCSIFSAVEQMMECGYSSPAVIATLMQHLNSKTTDGLYTRRPGRHSLEDNTTAGRGGHEHHGVVPVDVDDGNAELAEAQSLSDVVSRLTNRYGRLNHMSSDALGPPMISMATVATIAAIRSIVRDEQARIVQLSHSLGLDAETLEQSMRSLHQTGELLAGVRRSPQDYAASSVEPLSPATKRHDRIPPPGPVDFLFKMADGREGVFDASREACSAFGLFHGQKIRSHRYPELGQGTVIGVMNGLLWIHLDKDIGASFRRDNWQFADLYVLGSELQLEACGTPSESPPPAPGRNIKIGNRVRRGRSWQWHNQDGYMGNLGTVVDGASSDFWVSVEWDGGGRNTYRWGADGQYDLEIVGDGDKLHRDDTRGCLEDWAAGDCETLLTAEQVRRRMLCQGGGIGRSVTDLCRHAVRNGHVELYRLSMSALCYLASYDAASAQSLGLCLEDVVFFMHGLCADAKAAGVVRDYTDRLLCGRLLSVLTTVGFMHHVFREDMGGRTLPFMEVVGALKQSGRCSPLVISALCFLRLLVQIGTTTSHMNLHSNASVGKSQRRCIVPGPDSERKAKFVGDRSLDKCWGPKLVVDSVDKVSTDVVPSVVAESKQVAGPTGPMSDTAGYLRSALQDRAVLDDLLEIVLPVLSYHQSASAIVIVVDMLSAMLTLPHCLPALVSHGIEAILIRLANQLNTVEVTGSSVVIFQLVMKVMIVIEQRASKPMRSLLQSILQFACQAKDFETVVQALNSHIHSGEVVCRCLEILIGGRRRYCPRVATTQTWRDELTVGSKIDAKDKSQLWYEAVIRNTNDNDEVFVHYLGWGSKYDEWIPRASDRLQISHSETGYWRENLRLDDPVEILCLHHEGSEVKRRWFRGVVTRMNGSDKLLIEYDKRGCCEERWVHLSDGEEVCKVGTHVPSGLGPSSELLKSQRKKQLLQCRAFETALVALERHIDDEETTLACLEAVQYLISEDEDIALTCGQLMLLKPAEVLCGCIALHALHPGDEGGRSEDIMEVVCSVLLALSTSQDTKNFAVGDAVDAQWKRRGNQIFPARILRVHDEGMTFDIGYDDGDEEDRVARDRITHRSGACYYNAASFVREVVACDGHVVLMDVLRSHEMVQDKLSLIPLLSVLSAVIDMSRAATVVRAMIDMGVHTIVFEILDVITACKSSSRLTKQCLALLQHISSHSVQYKNELFHMGAHAMSINCVSAFPSQPSVLASSLGLLASIISKDGVYHHPYCSSSGGDINFAIPAERELFSSFWVSEDRLPSLDSPHWIDVDVVSFNRWREVSMLLRDYGSASPETVVVKYRAHRSVDPLEEDCDGNDLEFFEVKNITSLDKGGGWVQIVSREEVHDAHEQLLLSFGDDDGGASAAAKYGDVDMNTGGVLRIEIVRNHNNGKCSYVAGLKLLLALEEHETIDTTEEQRKDAIAAMDGVSMIVECLIQSKTQDRELYQSGKAFLQAFATNQQRAQFVVDCGGAYVL